MKQFSFIISGLLLIISCTDSTNQFTTEQQWAAVDFYRIKTEVSKALEEVNSIPRERMSRESLTHGQREMSQALADLRDSKISACISEKNVKTTYEDNETTLVRAQNRKVKIERDCIKQVRKDPEVKRFKEQLDEAKQATTQSVIYLSRTRDFLDKYTTDLIKNYCDDHFLLVVESKSVVSNKNGVVVDITDAIISEIKSENLVVKKKDFEDFKASAVPRPAAVQ